MQNRTVRISPCLRDKELEEAIEEEKALCVFEVTWSVADLIACQSYDVAPIFSAHSFMLLADQMKKAQKNS